MELKNILVLGVISCVVSSASAAVNLLTELNPPCTASSVLGPEFQCQYAYEGTTDPMQYHEWVSDHENEGAWIKIDFAGPVLINHMNLWQRCHNADQYRTLVLTFSDGTLFTAANLDNACNGGVGGRGCIDPPNGQPQASVAITPVVTTSVHIKGADDCYTKAVSNGIREIELMGEPCVFKNYGTCSKTCGIGTMSEVYQCGSGVHVISTKCCDMSCGVGGPGGSGPFCKDFPSSGGK